MLPPPLLALLALPDLLPAGLSTPRSALHGSPPPPGLRKHLLSTVAIVTGLLLLQGFYCCCSCCIVLLWLAPRIASCGCALSRSLSALPLPISMLFCGSGNQQPWRVSKQKLSESERPHNTVACIKLLLIAQTKVWTFAQEGRSDCGQPVMYALPEFRHSTRAFSYRSSTAPIITLLIPGTPLKTTHLQKRA